MLIQPGQTTQVIFPNTTLSLNGTSVPYFIKANTVGGGTQQKNVNIPVVSINMITFGWNSGINNPRPEATPPPYNSSDPLSRPSIKVNTGNNVAVDIYDLPMQIELINSTFSLYAVSGTSCTITNTTCNKDIGMSYPSAYQTWVLNVLPPGNYTVKVTAGKNQNDSKNVTRIFAVI